MTKVEYSDGSSVSFKYDADGNTTERVDAKSFGEPYTGATYYEYDKLNRPTLETTPTAKSIRYGYDYDGNLTSLEDKGGTVSYAHGSDDVATSLTEPKTRRLPQRPLGVHEDRPVRTLDQLLRLQTDGRETAWWWPLPTSGPLTFECEWPREQLRGQPIEIPVDALVAASRRARDL